MIGDGRSAALVARDGSIDWLCLPNLDSPSVFAAILDADRGGSFELQPAIPFDSSRRYLPRTNVLETTFATDRGVVRVVDAMTLPNHHLAPMRELARSIEGVSGTVPMRWRFTPRFDYGAHAARCEWRHGVPVATWGAEAIAIAHWDAGTPAWRDGAVEGRFEIEAGGRALIAMAAAYAEPLVVPGPQAIASRLDDTIRFWEQWSDARAYDGPWADLVLRSALALKLMIFAPSGAAVAAPTTSLPEEIGGDRNWDYRFCWIRDSNFMISALMRIGCHAEARSLFWWFMQATALTEPELHVLYRLDGGVGADERSIGLAGYRGSSPGPRRQRRPGAGPARHLRLAARDGVALQRRRTRARWRHRRRLRTDRRSCLRHLAAAGFGDLGGAERPLPFHALEGDVLGGARSRAEDGAGAEKCRPATRAVAAGGGRDPRLRGRRMLVRRAAQLHADRRQPRRRRQPADAAARRLRRSQWRAHPRHDRRRQPHAARGGLRLPLPRGRRGAGRRGELLELFVLAGRARWRAAGGSTKRRSSWIGWPRGRTTSGCTPRRSIRRAARFLGTFRRRSSTSR